MAQSRRNPLASQLAKKYICQQVAVKKKNKKKKIIPGGDSGSTSESLGSSSDATIGSVIALSAGTSGIIKPSSSAKRKKAVDQNKSSHERKEMEKEKGKAYHHHWSLPLGFSSLEAHHHPLMPPQQWWKEFPDQGSFRPPLTSALSTSPLTPMGRFVGSTRPNIKIWPLARVLTG